MNKLCYVGIDTSNYTTSAAVCDSDGRVVANLKSPLPVAEGGCGLRQSDALFAHVKNMPELMARRFAATKLRRWAFPRVRATHRVRICLAFWQATRRREQLL